MNEDTITINSVDYRGSICDGPGIRTVVFVQGCNVQCKGCQNPQTWDISKGKIIFIEELINEICQQSLTKRITISGGEPLLQVKAVSKLVQCLCTKGFDVALYTSYKFKEIPQNLLENLNYVKCGKYLENYRTTTIPYIGSKNQQFIILQGGEKIHE